MIFQQRNNTPTAGIGIATPQGGFMVTNGNVGIGTTVPGALLAIDTTSNEAARFYRPAATSGQNTDFYIGRRAATGEAVDYGFHYDSTTNNSYGYIANYGDSAGTGIVVQKGGNVGIGTTATGLRLGQKLEIAASANYGGMLLSTWSTDTSQAAAFDLSKSKSATIGTQSAVTTNDELGYTVFRGSDGTTFTDSSYIKGSVDAAVSAGKVPGRMTFWTSSTAGVLTERMRIDSAGNVGIGTTTPSRTLAVNGSILTVDNEFIAQKNGNVDVRMGPSFAAGQGAIGTLNGYPFDIYANSTRVARFDTSGNVGIGSTVPLAKLDVSGDANFDGAANLDRVVIRTPETVNNASVLAFGTSSNVNYASSAIQAEIRGIITQADPSALKGELLFRTNGGDLLGERMRIDSAGNVGIGTTVPAYLLDISGSGSTYGRVMSSNNYAGVRLSDGQAGGVEWLMISGYPNAGNFDIRQNGVLDALTILKTSGNVGIGTINPTKTLSIKGSTEPILLIQPTLGTQNSSINLGSFFANTATPAVAGTLDYITFGFEGTDDAFATKITSSVITAGSRDNAAADLEFFTKKAGDHNPAQNMTINSAGNVGIGTTVPGAKLNVIGGTIFQGPGTGTLAAVSNIRDSSTNGNELAIRIGTGRVDLLGTWEGTGIATDLTFTPTTAGGGQSEAMRVASTGNVGIGTTNPSATFDVGGKFTFRMAGGVSNGPHIGVGTALSTSGGLAWLDTDGNSNTWSLYNERGNATGHIIYGAKARGATTDAADGDPIIQLGTEAYSSGYRTGGYIQASVDGTFTTGQRAPTRWEFATNSANSVATERMRIDSAGNVGIGTMAPTAKLHVFGGSGNPVDDAAYAGGLLAKFQDGASAINQSYVEIRNTKDVQAGLLLKGTGLTGSQHFLLGLNNNSKLRIGYGTGITDSKDGSSGLTIQTDGNVGIGVTAPAALLQVGSSTNTYAGAGLLLGKNGAASGYISATDNLYIKPFASSGSGNGTLAIQDGSENTKFIFNTSTGNVGIGVTAPAAKLHINSSSGNGIQLHLDGTTTVGAAGAISDVATNATATANASAVAFQIAGAMASTGSGTHPLLAGEQIAWAFTDGGATVTNLVGLDITAIGAAAHVTTATGLRVAAPTGAGSNYAAVFTGGNVGIGSTTPQAQLDVSGATILNTGLSNFGPTGFIVQGGAVGGNGMRFITKSPGHGHYNWQISQNNASSEGLEFIPATAADGTTFTTPALTMLTNGNVGIGTTTPQGGFVVTNGNVGIGTWAPRTMLDVSGSVSVGNASQVGTLAVGNGVADARISGYFASILNSASANQWGVRVEPTCSSSATSVCRGVQAGVLTAAAAYTVGTATSLYVANPSKGAGSSITTNYGIYIADQNAGATNYALYSDTSAASYFGGNVGIGTTGPAAKLHIVGDAVDGWNASQLRITGATNGNYKLNIGYNTTSNFGEIQAGEEGVAYRNLILNGYGGNVGIGVTGPRQKLEVAGAILASIDTIINKVPCHP